jgi:hypothetical protein
MKYFAIFLLLFYSLAVAQNKILIYMDQTQTDHLKAYGIVYNHLNRGGIVDWLLNYRGGSFLTDYSDELATLCRIKGVSFQIISFAQAIDILTFVQSEEQNMDVARLEKAPKIAVYVPPTYQPWDDAVMLAMEYAEVPYDRIFLEEILTGSLDKYDWVHLHHEDFTGQYGKFYASYANAQWYREQQAMYEREAKKLGYKKVSEALKAVVIELKNFIAQGGFMFAMCSATDTYDIALASLNIDICETMFDGDPADPKINEKLDYSQTLAFQNFKFEANPFVYEYSDIDISPQEIGDWNNDYFTLFEFSAKYDPVPTMLTQNHVNVIRGFLGQTTMFRENLIKKNVYILGKREGTDQVKYIHGNFGRGFFTFYGGHDPEDYQHFVGDEHTDLSLHKNSPGYRLILNNILFPAAKKKKQKT